MDTRVDPNANRFCSRPWKQITFLSDGTAVCSSADGGSSNPLGNIHDLSFEEIWSGAQYAQLRQSIVRDINEVPICRSCPNRIDVPAPSTFAGLPKPKMLHLESVAACNLVCPGCDREAIEGGRNGKLVMDFESYKKIIDGLSPTLEYMEFHSGGENFMHKRWPEMLRYAKDRNPNLFILTSTNGHYFRTEAERQAVIDCGLDWVIFSIDGAHQESYVQYRVRGKFQAVIDNMKGVLEARRKSGKERPYINWRYILFNWNDSKEEMDLARSMAKEIGVDYLTWHLNVASNEMSSKRYYIGSPHLGEIEHELWDTVQNRVPFKLNIDFSTYTP